jgi:hypothetical protein
MLKLSLRERLDLHRIIFGCIPSITFFLTTLAKSKAHAAEISAIENFSVAMNSFSRR